MKMSKKRPNAQTILAILEEVITKKTAIFDQYYAAAKSHTDKADSLLKINSEQAEAHNTKADRIYIACERITSDLLRLKATEQRIAGLRA